MKKIRLLINTQVASEHRQKQWTDKHCLQTLQIAKWYLMNLDEQFIVSLLCCIWLQTLSTVVHFSYRAIHFMKVYKLVPYLANPLWHSLTYMFVKITVFTAKIQYTGLQFFFEDEHPKLILFDKLCIDIPMRWYLLFHEDASFLSDNELVHILWFFYCPVLLHLLNCTVLFYCIANE